MTSYVHPKYLKINFVLSF